MRILGLLPNTRVQPERILLSGGRGPGLVTPALPGTPWHRPPGQVCVRGKCAPGASVARCLILFRRLPRGSGRVIPFRPAARGGGEEGGPGAPARKRGWILRVIERTLIYYIEAHQISEPIMVTETRHQPPEKEA